MHQMKLPWMSRSIYQKNGYKCTCEYLTEMYFWLSIPLDILATKTFIVIFERMLQIFMSCLILEIF